MLHYAFSVSLLSIQYSVSALGTYLSLIPSVGLYVSGKCTMAKRLTGSGCRSGWWVGSAEGWVY